MAGSDSALASLAPCKTVILETRKRDGSWVPTAVSIVLDGGRGYFRTYDAAGKAKRLRNFPAVRVAPGTTRGRATGPAVDAQARLLTGTEAERARALLARRFPVVHGWLVPFAHRRKGWTTLHYELTAADGRGPDAADGGGPDAADGRDQRAGGGD